MQVAIVACLLFGVVAFIQQVRAIAAAKKVDFNIKLNNVQYLMAPDTILYRKATIFKLFIILCLICICLCASTQRLYTAYVFPNYFILSITFLSNIVLAIYAHVSFLIYSNSDLKSLKFLNYLIK